MSQTKADRLAQLRQLEAELRYDLPYTVREYLTPALQGDEEAARSLGAVSPNELRGQLALLFYLADVPLPAYRALLSGVWEHDHRYVIQAATNQQRIHAMFKKAQFPIPDHLPDTVRKWRGTSALSSCIAVRGYSWTLDRDVACWFAMRFAEKNGEPWVFAADVPRSSLLYYSNQRLEAEVVCFKVADPFLDGNREDWREAFDRKEEEYQRRRMQIWRSSPYAYPDPLMDMMAQEEPLRVVE